MKRTLFKSLLLAAVVAVLASCFPNEDYLFSDVSMCTVLGRNKVQTDGGDIYYVVKNSAGSDISDTLKRVMISCDVMSAVEGKQNEYNVHLIQLAGAFVKSPLRASTLDEDAAGHDGINIDQAWVSGGYLNLHVQVAMLYPSAADHALNIVYDDVKSNTDTLYFEMRHNAHGESPENPNHNPASFTFAGAYASFPLTGILPSGKSPVFHIEWEWYDGDEYSITTTKTRHSGNITPE